MTAPEITHLQSFILLQLSRGVEKGKALRAALKQEGISHATQTFHVCMERMKRDGLITSAYVKATGGARGRETAYHLTAAGRRALKDVRQFYRRIERLADE